MAASDILNSVDAQLAAWKNELLGEYNKLKSDYEQALAHIKLLEAQLEAEAKKSTTAIRTSATLLAHFGSVSRIFDEARNIALAAGADAESLIAKVNPAATAAVRTDLAAITDRVEAALHGMADQTSTSEPHS